MPPRPRTSVRMDAPRNALPCLGVLAGAEGLEPPTTGFWRPALYQPSYAPATHSAASSKSCCQTGTSSGTFCRFGWSRRLSWRRSPNAQPDAQERVIGALPAHFEGVPTDYQLLDGPRE